MPLPIPAPRESGYTTTTLVPLYWAAYGPAGAPRLLVLHGGPGASHDYLLPQMLELAERHDVLFYDQRGGGRSRSDDRAPVTWRTHVEDMATVVRELALGAAPLRVVGYSWGAMLALLYAIEASAARGERVEGTEPAPGSLLPDPASRDVALGSRQQAAEEPHLHPPLATLLLISPAPLTRAWRLEFEAAFAARAAGARVRQLREELAAGGLRERDPDAYRQRTFELSVAGYFADPDQARDLTPFRVVGRIQEQVWASLGDFDLVRDLGRVRVPHALVVHGRQDPIPLASSEAAARALGAGLVVLDGCGHVPYVEQPSALFAAAGEFLATTAPSPSSNVP